MRELGFEFEDLVRKYRNDRSVVYRGIILGYFVMVTEKLNPHHFFSTSFYPVEFRTEFDVLQFLHEERRWVDDRLWQTKYMLGSRS